MIRKIVSEHVGMTGDVMEVNGASAKHIPVLAKTLTELIHLRRGAVMVDATVGYGSHSRLFGQALGREGVIIGLDVDENCIETARIRLKDAGCKVILLRSNFSEIVECVHQQGIESVDFILADLGVCSGQLADRTLGLSFQTNMPLDMRMDKRLTTTAADIVNKSSEKTLADLIYRFGEEKRSRRIARYIVRQRRRPIVSTGQLTSMICEAVGRSATAGKRKERIHPATRTFQALRIAVNNELENLEKLLAAGPELLKDKGFMAVISFHSLEDRLVKHSFRKNMKDGLYSDISKKPIRASREEIAANPRSRSAKLRIAQKR